MKIVNVVFVTYGRRSTVQFQTRTGNVREERERNIIYYIIRLQFAYDLRHTYERSTTVRVRVYKSLCYNIMCLEVTGRICLTENKGSVS